MSRYADYMARWGVIGLGFTIPLTVALNNALLALMLAGWLLGGRFREKFSAFQHPVAIAALALFGLLALGTIYGDAGAAPAALYLRKYSDLLLIPVFLSLLRDARTRRHALHAFALSLALVLALSYAIKMGLLSGIPSLRGNPDYPVVFKEHLTHNILMAFGVFLFAWLALSANSLLARLCWAVLALLALANVTIMVHGATGYLILGGLLLLLGYQRLDWRGLSVAVLGVSLLLAALLAVPNPFQQRVSKITNELHEWRADRPARTSTGWRLEFYGNTLAIIADHPLLGVGTGGFPPAYAKKVEGTGRVATHNPHNEFLLITVQIGIAGLAALLWLFWRQWQLAVGLDTRLERELARGLVVTMVIGCMLNSLLLDHTEGLLYAWLTGVLYAGLKFGDE
ncbi:MAG: O-antigen ligase family protein [Betaproteobacteria bacterium]|nr:O-antigen ligase family protein [Betaproteobacteria bacterium]